MTSPLTEVSVDRHKVSDQALMLCWWREVVILHIYDALWHIFSSYQQRVPCLSLMVAESVSDNVGNHQMWVLPKNKQIFDLKMTQKSQDYI